MLRRSWTEISLSAIKNNYKIYSSFLKKGQELMAVVKADAYGHGDREVAAALMAEGCCNFAVSNINEAIRLRTAGIEGRILILGYTPVECAGDLVRYDITQTLVSESYAERLAAFCKEGAVSSCTVNADLSDGGGSLADGANKTFASPKAAKLKAQFALDTGMNRIGLDADKPEECEAVIRKYAGIFDLTGFFTHLCVADTPSEKDFTELQLAKFNEIVRRTADMKLPCVHCLNSAGGCFYNNEGRSDLLRLGIILYGLKPDIANTLPEGIRPALEWKTVISMLKTVHKGETVGYGRTWTADGDRIIATLPTGYADGYNRALSNKGYVVINGRRVPLVGRVCMDQMTADVTDITGLSEGDEVTLIGPVYGADEMAADAGTIGYEVVCDITARVERTYKD